MFDRLISFTIFAEGQSNGLNPLVGDISLLSGKYPPGSGISPRKKSSQALCFQLAPHALLRLPPWDPRFFWDPLGRPRHSYAFPDAFLGRILLAGFLQGSHLSTTCCFALQCREKRRVPRYAGAILEKNFHKSYTTWLFLPCFFTGWSDP